MLVRVMTRSLVLVFSLVAIDAVALACSCMELSQDVLDQSDTVFFGTVTSVNAIGCGGHEVEVIFDVIDADRGVSVGDQVVLTSFGSGKSCGVSVQAGESWLVYAEGDRLSLCSGSVQTATNPGFLLADRP